MPINRIKRLFEKPDTRPARVYRLPEGQRLYAIGDIHGRSDLLDRLLAKIDADDAARGPAETFLILLGDLVDRGPQSREVVETVIALSEARPHVRTLMGNHEEVLIALCDGDARVTSLFERIGGIPTLLSYGVDPAALDAVSSETMTALAAAHVPERHLEFLRGCEDYVVAGDYLFVHAGIRPGVALEEQQAADLRWIRAEFTASTADHGLMVIHGHSITEAVDACANRIGIDTGAFASGQLTAIGLEASARWFLTS